MTIKKFILAAALAAFAFIASEGVANAAYTHTVTLKFGARHTQVMSLQQTLNMTACKVAVTGAGSVGFETTYFGPATQAAVKCFQMANGLTADGIVGPATGARLAVVSSGSVSGQFPAGCTSAAGYSTTTGQPCSAAQSNVPGCTSVVGYSPTTGQKCDGSTTGGGSTGGLQGGAGSLEDVDLIASVSNEDVGEGANNIQVLGLDVEADDGSDLRLTAIRVEFDEQAAGGSDDFDDYADEVSIWLGSTKVGSTDVDDMDENSGVWSEVINLNNAVIKAGQTAKLYVAVSALDVIDSTDLGQANNDWDVTVANVRFVDAQGAVITDNSTGDLPATRDFQFTSFATASDVELAVSLTEDADETNESHIVNIDDANETDNVALLAFTLEAEGDSDINVTEIPVNIDVTGAANVDDVVSSVSLWMGNTELATEDINTGAGADETVTFEDLDIDVSAGEEVDLVVKGTFLGTDDAIDNGDTISVQLSGTEVDAIEAEDETGEELSATELTGTAVGEAHSAYDEGIAVTFVSANERTTFTGDAATEEDKGQFDITFKVTALDADMRVDRSCEQDDANAAGQGVEYTVTGDDDDAPACTLSSTTTDSEDTANTFEVDEGQTRTFTLSVSVTGDDDATGDFISVALASINWGTATDDTNANYYTFNLDQYKTDPLYLNSQ